MRVAGVLDRSGSSRLRHGNVPWACEGPWIGGEGRNRTGDTTVFRLIKRRMVARDPRS